jgi:hypothetical protein
MTNKNTATKTERRRRKRGTGTKLPAAPLFALWHNETDMGRIAEACGCSRAAVKHWAQNGITATRADEVACHIGRHPSNIWGQAWWDIAREMA